MRELGTVDPGPLIYFPVALNLCPNTLADWILSGLSIFGSQRALPCEQTRLCRFGIRLIDRDLDWCVDPEALTSLGARWIGVVVLEAAQRWILSWSDHGADHHQPVLVGSCCGSVCVCVAGECTVATATTADQPMHSGTHQFGTLLHVRRGL